MVSFHGRRGGRPARARIIANESGGKWTILLEEGSVDAWLASTLTIEPEDGR